jgi:hypothetical protein
MTQEEEKALLDSNKAMGEQIKSIIAGIEPLKSLAAKVPELEKSLADKDTKIAELAKGQTNLTQEQVFSKLKSAYPDVPETVLMALPADKREEHAKTLQDQYSKVKPSGETDPMKLWASAGGIAPATEAEREAKELDRKKEYEAHEKSGNVSGMLHQRLGDIVRQVIAPAFKR